MVYSTPGTGVNWNLDMLVSNAGGNIVNEGSYYQVNDTIRISTGDTLSILNNATLRFVVNTSFIVNGTLIINPPTGVLFTAVNTSTGYLVSVWKTVLAVL